MAGTHTRETNTKVWTPKTINTNRKTKEAKERKTKKILVIYGEIEKGKLTNETFETNTADDANRWVCLCPRRVRAGQELERK